MLTVLVVLLAAYGLVMASWQIYRRTMRQTKSWLPTVVVVVSDASDWIEWFIRKLSLESYASGRDMADILIVDMSASLETSRIVSILKQSYPFITYVASSDVRRWPDVAALLEARQRKQALLLEVRNEADVNTAIQIISHFFLE